MFFGVLPLALRIAFLRTRLPCTRLPLAPRVLSLLPRPCARATNGRARRRRTRDRNTPRNETGRRPPPARNARSCRRGVGGERVEIGVTRRPAVLYLLIARGARTTPPSLLPQTTHTTLRATGGRGLAPRGGAPRRQELEKDRCVFCFLCRGRLRPPPRAIRADAKGGAGGGGQSLSSSASLSALSRLAALLAPRPRACGPSRP